jgi:hypothetical protein
VEKSLRRRLLGKLGAIAIAAGAGFVEPSVSLMTIPESVIIALVEDEEGEPHEKRRFLPLLAKDPRAAVRERVADAAGSLAERRPEQAEGLIRELSGDGSPRVRAAAGRSLASLLAAAAPLDRLALVSRWTLSPNASERAAMARALQRRTPVFVSDLALEVLSNDADADVRAATARAMARRIHETPGGYREALSRLAGDSDPKVERTARRLLAALTGAPSLRT